MMCRWPEIAMFFRRRRGETYGTMTFGGRPWSIGSRTRAIGLWPLQVFAPATYWRERYIVFVCESACCWHLCTYARVHVCVCVCVHTRNNFMEHEECILAACACMYTHAYALAYIHDTCTFKKNTHIHNLTHYKWIQWTSPRTKNCFFSCHIRTPNTWKKKHICIQQFDALQMESVNVIAHKNRFFSCHKRTNSHTHTHIHINTFTHTYTYTHTYSDLTNYNSM